MQSTLHSIPAQSPPETDSLPLDVFFSTSAHSLALIPATYLLDADYTDMEKPFEKNRLLFAYRAVMQTIESCLAGKYSDFDGHTTTNCCHGMALLARNLIEDVLELDLQQYSQDGAEKICLLEQESAPCSQPCGWWVPKSLAHLACLYVLCCVKLTDPLRGGSTVITRLKMIAPITTNLCKQIAHDLKKRFANWIAMAYAHYFEALPEGMMVSGAPIEMWGKYVDQEFVRTDKHGLKYVSNLFSMQVLLGYLIHSEAKVALVNDILDSSGNLQERFVAVLEGDGHTGFRILTEREVRITGSFSGQDPVIVLGGCVYSDGLNRESLSLRMQPWLEKLSELMLACDVYYPQFSKVASDPGFDSSPIIPSEALLKDLINEHLAAQGMSLVEPSLFCATHIYSASMAQIYAVLSGKDEMALPVSFIPKMKA